ncbi:MAG: aminopeptidase P N-terminal domain-containing protein [Deltaproteobacteria bacterium]|nr:aminopeptidase P N-terminal domain-containing protein [Deltaproteobacteria bacterium]
MDKSVFAERRARVLERLGRAVMVLFAAPAALRNNDVEHEYRQDSDLYYLTGFDEPDAVLVLSGVHEERATLFVRPRDPEREQWDGARAGVDGARGEHGLPAAYPVSELDARLPDYLGGATRLYYRLGRSRAEDDRMLAAIDRTRPRARRGVDVPSEIVDPADVLHELRWQKSEGELALLRRAIEITAEGHVAAMAAARPGQAEFEVEALLRGAFRRGGSERMAYAPIVGSGANATVLHYRKNDRTMQEGDLLLIDAGAEYGYYAADVTRTFPVGGRFSAAQRELYSVVLAAQEASIAAVRPGATLDEVHAASVRVLTEGLVALGLLSGPLDDAISSERYRRFYMHRTSHWLGMDVHDVGRYFLDGRPRPLEPGAVLTVEPGLYIPAIADDLPADYRGIGIRIEDDVLVTPGGHDVLSAAIPKQVADVEGACRR